MEKLTKTKAKQLLIDGHQVKIKIRGVGNEYETKAELLEGEAFDMDLFLYRLLRLNPTIDRLPRMDFYASIEPVRVVYKGGWVIKHAVKDTVIKSRDKIRGPKQLVRYANSHYLKVINKGFLMPDFRKNLMF